MLQVFDAEKVKAVDSGDMIDDMTFTDRFGVKLYLSELSTGCKPATHEIIPFELTVGESVKKML